MYDTLGRGNKSYKLSCVEKTIADCFDFQNYGGGWSEIIKAFYKAKLNNAKRIEAFEINGNIAAT
jgi:predicted transcriptional regulator of viral defense system